MLTYTTSKFSLGVKQSWNSFYMYTNSIFLALTLCLAILHHYRCNACMHIPLQCFHLLCNNPEMAPTHHFSIFTCTTNCMFPCCVALLHQVQYANANASHPLQLQLAHFYYYMYWTLPCLVFPFFCFFSTQLSPMSLLLNHSCTLNFIQIYKFWSNMDQKMTLLGNKYLNP